MSLSPRMKGYYKSKLTPEQQKAAALLVDNDYRLLTEDGKKLSLDEIAERVGVSRVTLWSWRKDADFNAYMAQLADERLSTFRADIYEALLSLALGKKGNGIPSVKAIELYLKRFGLMTNRVVTESEWEEEARRVKSDEEIERDLEKLAELAKEAE